MSNLDRDAVLQVILEKAYDLSADDISKEQYWEICGSVTDAILDSVAADAPNYVGVCDTCDRRTVLVLMDMNANEAICRECTDRLTGQAQTK